MFRPNKISRIGLLMIVSEILIAAFVFRWLQSEFNSEKMELQKNLFDQFISARSRVMDSMISKKYIEPILGRSGGFKIQTIDVKGKIPQERHGASQIQVYNQDTARFIVKSDSFTANEASLEMRIDGDTSVDVLHRGIKMLITRVSTEDSVGGIFEKHVVAGDTALLKFCFAQNLKDNH